MSEKPKVELTEEEIAAQTQQIAELEKEIAESKEGATAAIVSLKNELKESREALAKAQEPPKVEEPKPQSQETDDERIARIMQETLDKREASRVSDLKSATLAEFITGKKEFGESDDPAGLRLRAYKDKLSRFTTDGLTTAEQFKSVFEDAYRLLGRVDTVSKNDEDGEPSPNPTITKEPKSVDTSTLTAEQRETAKRNGMTEEEYVTHLERHGSTLSVLSNFKNTVG